MQNDFIHWFHAVTPYIHAHRGKTLVIACPGETFANDWFMTLAHDINLLSSLGIRIILVHGARPQIEACLKEADIETIYHNNIRVSHAAAMASIKRAIGALRLDIEARLSISLTDTRKQNSALHITSGNYLRARPIGVVDGIDYQYSGRVRKVDTNAIRIALDHNQIVLVSPIGYSPSGEAFNLHYEEAAAKIAAALQADKLIYLLPNSALEPLPSDGAYTVTQIEQIVAHVENHPEAPDIVPILTNATEACSNNVERVHLIPMETQGSLVLELFTHQGIGIMITKDPTEIIRDATIDDIAGILRIIEPLEQMGILVRRDRQKLEQEIDRFIVIEHDQTLLGCMALYPSTDQPHMAELACFAVHPEHHHDGYGDRLLNVAIDRCRRQGITTLFVLTTQTAHWFIEHGFTAASVDTLPSSKRALYNWQRASKVFVYSVSEH